MRRADRILREFGCRFSERYIQKIGSLASDLEKVGLPGDTIMNTGRGKKVAHVIHLELEAVMERLGIARALFLLNQDRRMNVAVTTLRPRNGPRDLVDTPRQFRTMRRFQHSASPLKPFVEVPVIKRRSAMAPLGQP